MADATEGIHGPDVINTESAVAVLSEVLGKKVNYPGDDLNAAEQRFSKSMPSTMAYDVVSMFRGFHNFGSKDALDPLPIMLGRPLRSYRAYVEECADAIAHRGDRSAA